MTAASDEPSGDAIVLLARKWLVVVLFTALGAAASVTYAFLATKWYSASLTVIPSQSAKSVSSLSARLPDAFDVGSTDVQRIQAVLNSNSVADVVIDRFQLEKRYGTTHREIARAVLREHCATRADRRSGLVTLACEDTDPKLAMEMASAFGEVGNQVFGRVMASSAREERRFLETQVTKARQDVDDASQKLRDFQEKHHIVDLPEQSKAVITAMAQLKGELMSKQLELSYLTSFSARTEASVVQLQQQVSILESKLNQLEASQMIAERPPPSSSSAGSGSTVAKGSDAFFPGAMSVPQLRFELEQLVREQKIQETVFFMTTQRFEAAKIDEARDTSTFQILDSPTLPTFRSRPSRKKIAALGVFAGMAVGAMFVLIPFWWRRRLLNRT